MFSVFSGPELFYAYPNGDQVYNVTVIYASQQYHGELDAPSDENLGLRFFPRSEIALENISPPVRPIIARWLVTEKG